MKKQWWARKRIHYSWKGRIEKFLPRDHRLSSLGKPGDAKRRSSGRIFYPTVTLSINSYTLSVSLVGYNQRLWHFFYFMLDLYLKTSNQLFLKITIIIHLFSQICKALQSYVVQTVGKRITNVARHALCTKCCDGNLCNDNCNTASRYSKTCLKRPLSKKT